jgi:hypothetical protein
MILSLIVLSICLQYAASKRALACYVLETAIFVKLYMTIYGTNFRANAAMGQLLSIYSYAKTNMYVPGEKNYFVREHGIASSTITSSTTTWLMSVVIAIAPFLMFGYLRYLCLVSHAETIYER